MSGWKISAFGLGTVAVSLWYGAPTKTVTARRVVVDPLVALLLPTGREVGRR